MSAVALHLPKRRCVDKKPYGTLQLALNAAWLYAFKYKTRFAAYACPECQRLHLSRQTERTTALACAL